ncbi:hypothetical protein J3E69DRAFT_154213 [Trichoderma sp. SZMC 28015]
MMGRSSRCSRIALLEGLTPCRHTTENGSRSGQPPSPYHSAFSDWYWSNRENRLYCTVSCRIGSRSVSCRAVSYRIVLYVKFVLVTTAVVSRRLARQFDGQVEVRSVKTLRSYGTAQDSRGQAWQRQRQRQRRERTSKDAIKPAPVCVCVLYLCLDCFWSGMAQTDGLPWGWPCLVRAGFWGREFDGRPRGVKSNQNGSNRRGLVAGSAPSNLSGYLGLYL